MVVQMGIKVQWHSHHDAPQLWHRARHIQRWYGVITPPLWHAGYFNETSVPKAIEATDSNHSHWINLSVGVNHSINFLELVPIWLACVIWGKYWKNYQVICWSDNTQVVSSINRGTSTSSYSMCLLRDIFWDSVRHNFHLVSRHIPGYQWNYSLMEYR